jgi:hypothetical protein
MAVGINAEQFPAKLDCLYGAVQLRTADGRGYGCPLSATCASPRPRASTATALFPIKIARHTDLCSIHLFLFAFFLVSFLCLRRHGLNLGKQF